MTPSIEEANSPREATSRTYAKRFCGSFLAPPLAGGYEKLTQCARNDTRVGSRGAPSPARQVMKADFPVGAAGTFQLVEQLALIIAPRVSVGC